MVRAVRKCDQSLWLDPCASRPPEAALRDHERILEPMTETPPPEEATTTVSEPTAVVEVPPGQYWLRVHGYPVEIGEELIQYGDFFDPAVGPLRDDPSHLLEVGDVIVYYA